jgi:glycosyltransferase involved in cell wall biosynthesis
MSRARATPYSVLHVFSGDLWAGAEVAVHTLLDRLADAPDLRVTALSLNEGTLVQKLRSRGVDVVVVPERGNSFPAILRLARSALRARRIDLIHSHRYKENLLGFCLSRLLGGARLMATVHGLPELPWSDRARGRRPPWKVTMNHLLLRSAFDKVVAVSREIGGELQGRYGFAARVVDVIHNGIRIPAAAAAGRGCDGGPFRIGTVGRCVPVKGYDLFLEAAAAIARRRPGVAFSLLGDGPLLAPLRQKASELGIAHLVEFCEPVSDPAPFYQSLDLYMSTSLHEGIPLSVLEAMALERPVVAPRVGGLPEIVASDREGLLVTTRSPLDFADACCRLIDDPGRRDAMGRAARERVQSSFSDARMAAEYLARYRGLLMGGGG